MTAGSVAAVFSGAATAFMSRRGMLAGAGVLAVAAGCARSDWVGSTLTTVDVAGNWRGSYARGHIRGTIAMKLEQRGAKVTGTYDLLSAGSRSLGHVAGTVTGDKLRLEGADLLSGELTVGIDEMAGFLATQAGGYQSGRLSVLLLRQ